MCYFKIAAALAMTIVPTGMIKKLPAAVDQK